MDFSGTDAAYLLEVHVHENCRLGGLGSHLVKAVKEAAAKHGHNLVQLTVATGTDNSQAIRLYESAGFVRKSEAQGYEIWECALG